MRATDMVDEKYDPSWDYDSDEEGYDDEAFDRKYEEWEQRDWLEWLRKNLTFPFQAERMEDSYLDMFAPKELHARNPYPVGCQVTVSRIADGDCDPSFDGVIVEVTGGSAKKGELPLQDLEVRPKSDPNYWPVREFVVWYANR